MRRGPARALALLAGLAALTIAASLLPLRAWAARLLEIAAAAGPAGAAAYGLVYVLACVLMIPGSLLTLGAGFLYGTLGGLLVVIPASLAGASAAFLIGRHAARDWVRERVSRHPRFAAVDRAASKGGFRTVLLLRLSPFLPFNLLNYALGLSSVSFRDYVLGSLLGMLPATVVFVHAGALATDAASLGGPSGATRLGLMALGLVATIVILVLLTRAAKRSLDERLAR